MTARWMVLAAVTFLFACDPGSRSTIKPSGASDCSVALKSNADGYRLDMTLRCAGPNHTNCYSIGKLSCGGVDKPLSAPVAIAGCPGKDWCVDSCGSVSAPGTLWDIPELRQHGCDVYKER